MKMKQIFIGLVVLILGAFASIVTYNKGYDKGYSEAAQRGYEYAECVRTGGPIGMSDPPQCHDDKGTHYGP